MTPARRRMVRRTLVLACVGVVIVFGLIAPASTRQGVNFQVSQHRIPVYVKALDFFHRHSHYRLLADEIVRGLHTDGERVLAVLDWTRQHIRRTPKGWPIVDDHILDIIIRGYGVDDQMADVFTTLSTYAGVPAFWKVVKAPGTDEQPILSFARVEGRWAVFDVANGVVFTDTQGRLADLAELLADPAELRAIAGALTPRGHPYWQYLETLAPFQVPAFLRAEEQMPWPRLTFEVRRALHLIHEDLSVD